MELLLLMAAVTLLIMLLSFLSLTEEERELSRNQASAGGREQLPAGGD